MVRSSRFVVVAAVIAVACSGSGPGTAPPLGLTIGPAGGDLVVGSGLLTLSVPAGALIEPTTVRVTTGEPTPLDGWQAVSSAFAFVPADLTFATAATLTMPYSTARQGATVTDAELRIAFENGAGEVSIRLPGSIGGGSAVVAAAALGTYWVLGPDVIDADSLFPLNQGDRYVFDSGLQLQVRRSTTEPDLGGINVAVIELTDAGRTFGIYLDDRAAQLGRLGTFAAPDFQEVFATSQLLVDVRDPIGTVRPSAGSFVGHAPFGSTAEDYLGIAALTTTIAGHETLRVPLGSYDTVRVVMAMAWSNSEPAQGDEHLEFWFSRRIGPIALRLSAGGVLHRLVEGTVGGQPIAAR